MDPQFLEDDDATVEVVPDIGPTVKTGATSQMEAAIVALSRELSKLRTGRASAGAFLQLFPTPPLKKNKKRKKNEQNKRTQLFIVACGLIH